MWLLPAAPRARDSRDSSQHCFAKTLGELCPMRTRKRSPYGHTQGLRPVNTSTYTYNNISSKHIFPFLFNSSIQTALAILLRTRLYATTSIFCYVSSNRAHTVKLRGSYFGCCGSATNFRAHTWLKGLHKVLLPASGRQTRQIPFVLLPQGPDNQPGLTCDFYS